MNGRLARTRRAAMKTLLAACAASALPGCGTGTDTGTRTGTGSGSRSAHRRTDAPPPTWREPFGERFVVVLDPGHGGNDAGTRARNGLLEKDVTLDLARRLRARLVATNDIDVVLTRERDVWLSPAERVTAIRAADADLVVSLHFNDLPERDVALVETYYAHASNIVDSRSRRREKAAREGVPAAIHPDEPNDVSFTRGSKRFATLVQRHVFAAVAAGNDRAIDAGVKRDTLFVLTRGATSGALVELTCMSNDDEAERLRGDAYRDALAAAIATAIEAYRASSNVIGSATPAPVERDAVPSGSPAPRSP